MTATHLNHLILSHAAELLGRQETQALLDHLAKDMPKIVEDLVPKTLPLGVLQKVLQNLLEEDIAIRDMRTIIETVADHAPRTQSPDDLISQVRLALGRAIAQQLFPGNSDMQVMSLDPTLERLLAQAVAGGSENTSFEPGLADTLVREAATASSRQESLGLPPVLLVPGSLREAAAALGALPVALRAPSSAPSTTPATSISFSISRSFSRHDHLPQFRVQKNCGRGRTSFEKSISTTASSTASMPLKINSSVRYAASRTHRIASRA